MKKGSQEKFKSYDNENLGNLEWDKVVHRRVERKPRSMGDVSAYQDLGDAVGQKGSPIRMLGEIKTSPSPHCLIGCPTRSQMWRSWRGGCRTDTPLKKMSGPPLKIIVDPLFPL